MGGGWSTSSPTSGLYGGGGHSGSITDKIPKSNNNVGDIVIIPVDESKQAEAAFEWYAKHIHKQDNVVRVIHCQELQLAAAFLPDIKASTIEEQLVHSRVRGKRLIEKYEKKLATHQISGSVHSEFGPAPGEMVIGAVDKYNGTHVVMGTRGFGIIRRTILGSVSQYVIMHSHVPVSVIPPEVQHRFF